MCSGVGLFVAVGGEVAKVKSEWRLRFDIGKCTLSSFVYLDPKTSSLLIAHSLQLHAN